MTGVNQLHWVLKKADVILLCPHHDLLSSGDTKTHLDSSSFQILVSNHPLYKAVRFLTLLPRTNVKILNVLSCVYVKGQLF